jgi:ribonuclease HI
MSKPGHVTIEEIVERLHARPFAPFEIVLADGARREIRHSWQVLATPPTLYIGEPTDKPGVVAAVTTVEWTKIVELANLGDAQPQRPNPKSKPTAPSAAHRVVQLFSDGACMGNPGKGGWAFILRDSDKSQEVKKSGADRHTTNNRMELTSVIKGLEEIDPPAKVLVTTDSQYVAKGLNEWMAGWKRRGWKRYANGKLEPVANLELWQRLDQLCQRLDVTCRWVRGHAGHPENEECDRLAVAAYQDL